MRVIAGLTGKTILRLASVGCAFIFGLLLLSGCESNRYPDSLVYPPRTDPLVVNSAEKDAPAFDRPGEYPDVLFVGLSHDEKTKLLADPSKMKDEQRQDLDQALDRIFGTPAHPQIVADGDAADLVKNLSQTMQLDDETLAHGSVIYRHQCLHCHGLQGDGHGPTSPWVNPHPRDYRQGRFKFTSSNQPEGTRKPRRDDLLHTIREGIEGSSMPSFRLLPDDEVEALASYVTYLSLRGQTEFQVIKTALSPEGLDGTVDGALAEFLQLAIGEWLAAQAPNALIQPGPPPNLDNEKEQEESVRRGFDLFVRKAPEGNKKSAGCLGCHTDFGRRTPYKYDVWGTIVRPADLTTGIYHGGRRPIDLYWRIHSGINGVNMPASNDNLEPKDIWDLVSFLRVLPYPNMLKKFDIHLESE